MDDCMIIDLYWARSEDAISETDKKYGRFCYGLSFNILGDSLDAEECVSDTYMAAWDAMPPHRPGLLKAFLGKLSRRIAISRWRGKNAAKRKGMTELVLDELSDCVPGGCSPAEELELKELAAVIDGFLRSLPEAERLVFIRRYWYLDPIKDICARYGYSQSKVKTMLYRMRAALKFRLSEEGYIHEQ